MRMWDTTSDIGFCNNIFVVLQTQQVCCITILKTFDSRNPNRFPLGTYTLLLSDNCMILLLLQRARPSNSQCTLSATDYSQKAPAFNSSHLFRKKSDTFIPLSLSSGWTSCNGWMETATLKVVTAGIHAGLQTMRWVTPVHHFAPFQ